MKSMRAQISRTLLLILAAFALGLAAGRLLTPGQAETATPLAPLQEALDIIQARYIEPVETELLVEGALAGMAAALDDQFSYYIDPETYAREYHYTGEFTGIGVMVKTNAAGEIEVDEVVPGSPADRVGARRGDIFHAVDGQTVAGYTQEELSAMVPGPRGTSVRVTFRRGEELLTFDIVRDVFVVPNVRFEMVAGRYAYIAMKDFHKLARAQLDEALAAIDVHASAGLIFDLRGNPGGTIESAIDIASVFFDDAVILQQVDRDGNTTETRSQSNSAGINAPIVLLVDAASASASEVLAGALQDHGLATIIGETTFGKGTVQTIQELGHGGALRLTVRRFRTPKGREIEGKGIAPDIVVAWDAQTDEPPHLQLEATIQYLDSLVPGK